MAVAAQERAIWQNLDKVRGRMAEACRRAGRPPEPVRLVVVTKGQGLEAIRAAHAAGLREFGENRVEEALPKIQALQDLAGVRWHMIGHVQTRKAELVVGPFAMVHSLDRMKLASRLDRFAAQAQRRLPVLLECNVSGEPSKEGWDLARQEAWDTEVKELLGVADLPNLDVQGLMTMAPLAADPEFVRPVFRRLTALARYLEGKRPGCWRELSMGMTDDFEVALEEGATLIRLGRAIFGQPS